MITKIRIFIFLMTLSALSVQAATVGGVVKENDSTGAIIANAIVRLTTTAGATLIDTTNDSGTYSFTKVSVATHRISAAKTGFRIMTPRTVSVTDSTAKYTENLYLVATGSVIVAKISGTVFDSVSGTPATVGLAGAKVLFTSRAGTGGRPATRDSVMTGASGTFAFDSVATGTYTLTISAATHISHSATVTVTTATPQVLPIKLVAIQVVTDSISGMVTDSTSGKGIKGAGIYVVTRPVTGPGTTIDSTVTDSMGKYNLGKVPSNATYTIRTVAPSYLTSNMSVTLTGTTARVVNIKLVLATLVTITGTVTDSTSAGIAMIAEAKITLRSGSIVSDSAITGSAGTYSLTKVESGVSYTIRAEATGFSTVNTNVIGAARTINFRLVKIPTGNLIISVKKRSDSTAVTGALVTATLVTPLTATTGTNGIATFMVANIGAYAISVSAANFTAISTNTTLTANSNDTIKIFLVTTTSGTKTLSGTVKDSMNNTPLSKVAVKLVIAGSGVGGSALTFIDSTDTNGNYMFVGLPLSKDSGVISAMLAGYGNYTNSIALGTINKADTAMFNFKMLAMPVAIKSTIAHNAGIPDFSVAPGVLRLRNIGDAGTIKVFGINGRLLFQSPFNAKATSLSFPANVLKAGNTYIVCVSQKNALFNKQVMMP